MLSRLAILAKITTLAATFCFGAAAIAQDFPTRPIQLIYPWNASGPTFAVSQIIATAMGEELDGAVAIVSKTGASGLNAFKTALAEPGDGYTVIDGYLAPLVIVPMGEDVNYTYKDFKPLHFSTSNAFAVISRAEETRWSDLDSLIAYLKENPGETRYSAGPDLALPHMIGAMLMQNSETVSRHIPYSEINDAAKDLRSGILDWMVVSPGVYKSNESHLRVEAVLADDPKASDWYGGAKTAKELGFDFGLDGLATVGWTWWLVKGDTPDEIVQILRDAQARALAREDVRQKVAELGFVMNGYTADQYEELVAPVAEQLSAAREAIQWEKDAIADLN